jgi:hypothetical protein
VGWLPAPEGTTARRTPQLGAALSLLAAVPILGLLFVSMVSGFR